jgi:DNA-binding MarR family transcriptional regulator
MRDKFMARVSTDLLSVPPLVSRLIRKKVMKPILVNAEMDLRIQHFEIMRLLREKGVLRPAEIGEKLCFPKAQVTYLTDKLVDLGFLKREGGENDRRTLNISITEKGNKVVEEQDFNFTKAVKDNMVNLSDTELETLSNSLRALRNTLSKLQ